jgi:hypothetical protein
MKIYKNTMKAKQLILILLMLNTSVGTYAHTCIVTDTIPSMIKGKFLDDYGIHYIVTDTLWTQLPDVKYHIISWNAAERYILARNDDKNPSERGLYTRIDYMSFTNMEPFLWGFCLTNYNAKTIEEARIKAKPDRENPIKGCNGYPFSRMKRID